MTRFSTIDGLFRPNYHIYNPVIETKDSEIEVPYKNENITRIKLLKDFLTNLPIYPEYREELSKSPEDDNTLIEVNDSEEVSATLKKLREDNPLDYATFRLELDKFIENNPLYASIKDNLDYLAALESAYKLGVENYQGSGALGWFLFMDYTRKAYNTQTRLQFAKDPQALLLAAAKYYTKLQDEVRKRGGNLNDFTTMYGAWWRPESAYAYLNNPNYDFKTKYNESFKLITQRARNLVSKYEKSNS